MERRIAPSVRIEDPIEQALLDGVSSPDKLSQLGRLGAQLILQRAAEDEVAAFLGRARYERTSEAAASRNGRRPRRVQTAEGEITIAMLRSAAPSSGSSARSSPTRGGSSGQGRWRRSSSGPTSGPRRDYRMVMKRSLAGDNVGLSRQPAPRRPRHVVRRIGSVAPETRCARAR